MNTRIGGHLIGIAAVGLSVVFASRPASADTIDVYASEVVRPIIGETNGAHAMAVVRDDLGNVTGTWNMLTGPLGFEPTHNDPDVDVSTLSPVGHFEVSTEQAAAFHSTYMQSLGEPYAIGDSNLALHNALTAAGVEGGILALEKVTAEQAEFGYPGFDNPPFTTGPDAWGRVWDRSWEVLWDRDAFLRSYNDAKASAPHADSGIDYFYYPMDPPYFPPPTEIELQELIEETAPVLWQIETQAIEALCDSGQIECNSSPPPPPDDCFQIQVCDTCYGLCWVDEQCVVDDYCWVEDYCVVDDWCWYEDECCDTCCSYEGCGTWSCYECGCNSCNGHYEACGYHFESCGGTWEACGYHFESCGYYEDCAPESCNCRMECE